jgi:hypothetical protein
MSGKPAGPPPGSAAGKHGLPGRLEKLAALAMKKQETEGRRRNLAAGGLFPTLGIGVCPPKAQSPEPLFSLSLPPTAYMLNMFHED